MSRSFQVSLLLFAALGTSASYAAGAPKPPSAKLRATLGTVAVVAGRFVPDSNLVAFAGGKGKGAAFSVAAQITNELPGMNLSGALAEGLLTALARETAVQVRSADAKGPVLPEEKPSYQSLNAHGIDTVLEVAVTSVGLEGGDNTPLITFFMNVGTRLVRVADNKERYLRVFRFSGRAATLDGWTADNGSSLREQLTQGYERLADRITTELFLLTPMKIGSGNWSAEGGCWLRPIYPEFEVGPVRMGRFPSTRAEPGKIIYSVVDSLQPRVQWETFPLKKYLKKHLPISDVRYDLRIWKVEADYPESLVYEREGLLEAFHKLEYPLEPGTQYFWSVRSRFKTDGRTEVTRWAFTTWGFAGCNYDQIPASPYLGYFRFATPNTQQLTSGVDKASSRRSKPIATAPAAGIARTAPAITPLPGAALTGWRQKAVTDFQPLIGKWEGFSQTRKGKKYDYETTYRDDGTYTFRANRGMLRSGRRNTRIVGGVYVGRGYTSGQRITIAVYEDAHGNHVLKALRADGLTWTVAKTEYALSSFLAAGGDKVKPAPMAPETGTTTKPAPGTTPSATVTKAAPAATSSPGETIPKGTASTAYKIAIFPFESDSKCIGRSRPADEKFASELVTLITRNESLKLTYSYYDKDVNQPPIARSGGLWKGSKPNVAEVAFLGSARGVDAVVMYWRADSAPGEPYCTGRQPPFPIDVYVIDVKEGKIYTLKGREKDVVTMTGETFSMFLTARRAEEEREAQMKKPLQGR